MQKNNNAEVALGNPVVDASKGKLGDLQIRCVIICLLPPTALGREVFFTIIILPISIIIILINSVGGSPAWRDD